MRLILYTQRYDQRNSQADRAGLRMAKLEFDFYRRIGIHGLTGSRELRRNLS